MMQIAFVPFIFLIGKLIAPPVDIKISEEQTTLSPDDFRSDPDYRLEYERYLQEVVQLLESDADFKSKLEKAKPEDIDSGKIANELAFVNHGIRDKLNEAKRREVERINEALAKLALETTSIHSDVISDHRDHFDHKLEKFEMEDLKKLIYKAKKDMDQIDELRQLEFKQYEMEKRYKQEQELSSLQGDELKQRQNEEQLKKKMHADHEKVNLPLNEQQLEEVWKIVHDLDGAVNPQTLFNLHDVDGNGFLDVIEVEALFQHELDKVYESNKTEDDSIERIEEMNRMRKDLYRTADTNKDKVITFEEFNKARKEAASNKDKEWETLEKLESVFTEDEYKHFVEMKHALAALEPSVVTLPAQRQ